jgi:hypothetical protein
MNHPEQIAFLIDDKCPKCGEILCALNLHPLEDHPERGMDDWCIACNSGECNYEGEGGMPNIQYVKDRYQVIAFPETL